MISVFIFFPQVSANLKLSEKQEVKKELVSEEERESRAPCIPSRWEQWRREGTTDPQ